MSHFLFATDFSPTSTAAFKQLQDLAIALRPRITLLHVYEIAGRWGDLAYQALYPEFFAMMEAELEARAQQRLGDLHHMLASYRIEARSACLRGHAGKTIVSFARTEAFSLILLGRRGLSPAADLFLGSTCRYVLQHHAPCPVLVLPGPRAPSL